MDAGQTAKAAAEQDTPEKIDNDRESIHKSGEGRDVIQLDAVDSATDARGVTGMEEHMVETPITKDDKDTESTSDHHTKMTDLRTNPWYI